MFCRAVDRMASSMFLRSFYSVSSNRSSLDQTKRSPPRSSNNNNNNYDNYKTNISHPKYSNSTTFAHTLPSNRYQFNANNNNNNKNNKNKNNNYNNNNQYHSHGRRYFSSAPLLRTDRVSKQLLLSGFGVGASIIIALCWNQMSANAEDEKKKKEGEEVMKQVGLVKSGLPEYTRVDVAKHKTKETGIWVTYKNGVYDITDFGEAHPGGDKILLAAGASLEPFWAMYAQHYTEHVAEMLESMRIGNLKKGEEQQQAVNANDPYSNEPTRHPALYVRSAKPFNAEVPAALIADNMVTPNELFYVRNHLPVPLVNPNQYVLEIVIEANPERRTKERVIKLTLNDLKTKFKKQSVMAAIQCAGNRRDEMSKLKAVKGGGWEIGAISNAVWTGVPLRDVLLYAGLNEQGEGLKHVQFTGLDRDFEKAYGSSIHLERALDPKGEVLLAYEMNGKELPRDHGYPLRAVVPGVVGARNVKWLGNVKVSQQESPSHWQQFDYKGFPPQVDWHNVDWKSAPAIEELPVQSAISQPLNNSTLSTSDEVAVKGYAWSGAGRGIVRVDVSIDGGKNWQIAELETPDQAYNKVWGWTIWKATIPVPKELKGKKLEITCKAVDSAYNTQPERVEPIWNLRGVLNNAWHRVNVTVPPPSKK